MRYFVVWPGGMCNHQSNSFNGLALKACKQTRYNKPVVFNISLFKLYFLWVNFWCLNVLNIRKTSKITGV